MKIGIVGCGNVGFSHLLWLAQSGFTVKGYDIDNFVKNKIMNDLGKECLANTFFDLIDCDSIHICVPTESDTDGSADMSIFMEVINSLAEIFRDKHSISIVQRSTCPPGTADKCASLFTNNVSYGVNPSFLRKSSIKKDTEEPERIAIGGSGLVIKHLKEIYSKVNSQYFLSENRTTVELLKYIENAIDSLLISFWNEMLDYSTLLGLSAKDFVLILEKICDRNKFKAVVRVPGKAFGLWCLPKDISALVKCMDNLNIRANTLKGVISTNEIFKEANGISELPAQSLWENRNGSVKILPKGVEQIENFINKNSYNALT